MTLNQAISHLTKFAFYVLIQETAAKFKGTFCDWSWSQPDKSADSEFWWSFDVHPRKQNSRPGVDCEWRRSAGSRKWLACCPPHAIHSKAQRRKWVILWQVVFKNDHTSFRYLWYTRIKRIERSKHRRIILDLLMIIHKVCCQVLPYKRWKEMLPGSNRFEWSWVKSTAWYCNLDMAWQKAKLKTHFEKSPQKSVSCFLQATISYITMPTCSLFSFLFLLKFHLLAA